MRSCLDGHPLDTAFLRYGSEISISWLAAQQLARRTSELKFSEISQQASHTRKRTTDGGGVMQLCWRYMIELSKVYVPSAVLLCSLPSQLSQTHHEALLQDTMQDRGLMKRKQDLSDY